VGAAFLEETFSAPTAPPPHRLHQKAAQAILKSLLPQAGTDIKGNMRPQQELLEASGYGDRPKEFADLLRILDSELRLITPSDPEGMEEEIVSTGSMSMTEGRYWQLTHDYLVTSVRAWLTRKQKETRRGRTELRLAERAALWNATPENRQLPTWWEWANINLYTRRQSWTAAQRRMMARATRYHAVRGFIWATIFFLILLLLGWRR
jgi:hypothetical protein